MRISHTPPTRPPALPGRLLTLCRYSGGDWHADEYETPEEYARRLYEEMQVGPSGGQGACLLRCRGGVMCLANMFPADRGTAPTGAWHSLPGAGAPAGKGAGGALSVHAAQVRCLAVGCGNAA